ncbi:MAG TPA: zinc ABC transporter substrate-binding protein [Dongiaceae bacterium]
MKITNVIFAAALICVPGLARGAEPTLTIVAAENFYGYMAQQIAGSDAKVSSILSNPNQDPHDFEASPSTARLIADAKLVIYNGADYDPWIESLLNASKSSERRTIVAADLLGRKSGDNPHLWYDPATMPTVAKALEAELEHVDPQHAAGYQARLKAYLASLQLISEKIAELRKKYGTIEVTATEPVFGYMAQALGFKMRNEPFQIAMMNGTEPSASEVADFEADLRDRKVRVLFYNNQVTDDLTSRLQKLARESKVPVVGVSETEPLGTNFQDWMLNQLVALDNALASDGL